MTAKQVRDRNRRLQRMAEGQCLKCPHPAQANRTMCRACALRSAAASNRRYHAMKVQKVAA